MITVINNDCCDHIIRYNNAVITLYSVMTDVITLYGIMLLTQMILQMLI